MKIYTLITLVFLLAGCGGGSEGDDNPAPPTSYTVQTSFNSGGAISPTSRTVTSGQSATFTITPEVSHNIQSVTGCGGTLSGQTYTTGPITEPCTVQAVFELKRLTVTSTVLGEGEISPTTRVVNYGDTTTFSLTPALGFQIETVSGCEGSLEGVVYTTSEITTDCAVQARFNPLTIAGANTITGEQLIAEVNTDTGWAFGAETLGYIPRDEPGSPVSLLKGYHPLYPLFDFELVKGDEGSSAEVVLSFEAPIPEGSVVLKFGPQEAGANSQWYELNETSYSFSENRRSLTLSVTDGELGDDDLSVNGYIKDPVVIAAQLPMEGATLFPITVYTTAPDLAPDYRMLWAEQNTSAVIELGVPTGYQISSINAGGCNGSLEGQIYTTEAISTQCHISVTLNVANFVITAVQSAGGMISPDEVRVNYRDTAEFTLTPDDNHQITSVTGCDGSLVGNVYTTGPAIQNCEISAVFSRFSFEVSAIAGSGGSITPASQTVTFGAAAEFTITPNNGYRIEQVTGCSGNLTDNTYTTAAITENCSVTASFSALRFEVTATAGSGGSITPASQTVTFGAAAEFTVTPNNGYRIEQVTGCSGSLNGNIYTTGAITAHCAVSASFILEGSLIVTVQSDEGGVVSPERYVGMQGDKVIFEITPNPDFRIASVTGCAGVLTGNIYEIASLAESCTLVVDFKPLHYVVTVQSSVGATIEPASYTGTFGEQVSISIIPDTGYILNSVAGCDGTLNDTDPTRYVYTTAALTANCQVDVVMAIQTIIVSTEVISGLGEISPASQQVNYGQPAEFTITPAAEYNLGSVQGCGGALQNNLYVTAEIYSACTVSVTFTPQVTAVVPDALLAATIKQTLNLADDHELTADDLARLTVLNGSSQDIIDLTGLEYATSLRELQLNSTLVTDLTPLTGLPLTELRLNFTQVSDLTPLAGSTIEDLWLSGSLVSDISPLSNMGIRFIDLSATDVSDISVVSSWQSLYGLQLSDTKVLDLTPAVSSGLPNQNTKWVQVYGCLSLNGYSRSQLAITTLKQAGVIVDAYDKSIFNKGSCPDTVATTTANLTTSFSNSGDAVELEWLVNNPWDNGAWRCSIHFNLDQQLARVANEVVDDCNLDTTYSVVYAGSAVKPSVVFEDGLGGRLQVDGERLIASDRPATASYDSYDWGQVVLKSNPKLVPGRDALLRIHFTTTDDSILPEVSVTVHPAAGESATLTPSVPVGLQREKAHNSLAYSYNVVIPDDYLATGTHIDIWADGMLVEQVSPSFANIAAISSYLVPIEVAGIAPVVPDLEVLEQNLKRFWPLNEVNFRVTEPLISAADNPTELDPLLDELTFYAQAQSNSVYFYGYVANSVISGPYAGLAYGPYEKTAVGVDSDQDGELHAHELGHNFGLPHINCGGPLNADVNYPYDPATTGSVGIDVALSALFQTAEYKDVMSYCWPQHVSDYNYERVQDHLELNPPVQFASAGATAKNEPSLYIDGLIKADGTITVTNLLPVGHRRQATTEKRLKAVVTTINGQQQTIELNLPQLMHGKSKNQFFYGYLPQNPIKALSISNGSTDWILKQTPEETKLSSYSYKVDDIQVKVAGNQVCLNWPALQFDKATLMHHGEVNSIILHNITSNGQCRAMSSLPLSGEWVISLRKGLTVKQVRQQVGE